MKYSFYHACTKVMMTVISLASAFIVVFCVGRVLWEDHELEEVISAPEVVQHVQAPNIDEDPWTPEIQKQRDRLARLRELQSKQPKVTEKTIKVRRFAWESPSYVRGKIWSIPENESVENVITGFLRICITEADGNLQDCVGIWQVINNVRSRSCNRNRIRKITECNENGETLLSTMRRAQRHAMGMVKTRNKRGRWIRNLKTSCGIPEGWTGTDEQWNERYLKRCIYAVMLGRSLIRGYLESPRPGSRLRWIRGVPIAWGGRCESGRDACDDPIACARGLARIKGTRTLNAFWRRPANRDEVDPICKELGY